MLQLSFQEQMPVPRMVPVLAGRPGHSLPEARPHKAENRRLYFGVRSYVSPVMFHGAVLADGYAKV